MVGASLSCNRDVTSADGRPDHVVDGSVGGHLERLFPKPLCDDASYLIGLVMTSILPSASFGTTRAEPSGVFSRF